MHHQPMPVSNIMIPSSTPQMVSIPNFLILEKNNIIGIPPTSGTITLISGIKIGIKPIDAAAKMTIK